MPSFGRDTIRYFKNDVSDMQHFAARNFEDLLQLALPAFEGLLTDKQQERIVQDLLFDLMTFHAHAKLRMHTDTTLKSFRLATRALGQSLRRFSSKTCTFYADTNELPREIASRLRKAANKAKKKGGTDQPISESESSQIQGKKFSMETYKTHALSHYPDHAEKFGTYDSVSTRSGEREHCYIKYMYEMVSKKDHTAGITVQERRHDLVRKLAQDPSKTKLFPQTEAQEMLSGKYQETLESTNPSARYHIGTSQKNYTSIYKLTMAGKGDPALVDFRQKLEMHLLKRLLPNEDNHDLDTIGIVNDRIIIHNLARFNITTYDCRRDQDVVNPKRHADIMMLSSDTEADSHPYIYARVIGIYHVNIRHFGPKSASNKVEHMDVLHVRWFEHDMTYPCGWNAKRLPRLQFLPQHDSNAFGFVDPQVVLRGCYLMPAFAYGTTTEYLNFPNSIGRPPRFTPEGIVVDQDDFKYYYVGIAVDRDMWMRYRGGGVGHNATRRQTQGLEEEALGIKSKGKMREEKEMEVESDSDDTDHMKVPQVPEAIDEAEKSDIDEEVVEEDSDYSDENNDPSDWDRDDNEGEDY
ncbi:hypothetical protein VKT23_013029 [Stygiomarasmius scandens]|uniref:Uncharacterized protein n=1 Tax=Marasmiellus scandens TaxID=2682957 RepID=A0ABR1J495_9AGAR